MTPATANTAFNITNGDVTRWKHVRCKSCPEVRPVSAQQLSMAAVMIRYPCGRASVMLKTTSIALYNRGHITALSDEMQWSGSALDSGRFTL